MCISYSNKDGITIHVIECMFVTYDSTIKCNHSRLVFKVY